MKIALYGIDMKGIEFDESEDELIDYDYEIQDNIFIELNLKKNSYDNYQQIFKRAEQMTSSSEQKQKFIDSSSRVYSEDTFFNEMQQYTTKERADFKMCSLDNYCLFITAKYLSTGILEMGIFEIRVIYNISIFFNQKCVIQW